MICVQRGEGLVPGAAVESWTQGGAEVPAKAGRGGGEEAEEEKTRYLLVQSSILSVRDDQCRPALPPDLGRVLPSGSPLPQGPQQSNGQGQLSDLTVPREHHSQPQLQDHWQG